MVFIGKVIFIVENDENIREMVRLSLISFSHEAVAFDNAEDALAAAKKTLPDMVILDSVLPGMSGSDALRELRGIPKAKDLPAIVLTAKGAEIDKAAGSGSGADDYIVKPFGVMELGARIRSVFRHAGKSDRELDESLSVSDLSFSDNTREVLQGGEPLNLTFKEYELLCLLIEERGRIVPRDELLNTIWGLDYEGEPRTLDIHIRTLRKKLGDDADDPRYIKTIRNIGYRFIGD